MAGSATLSLASRIGRFCERLNGFALQDPPRPAARSSAEMILRGPQGQLYVVRVTPYA